MVDVEKPRRGRKPRLGNNGDGQVGQPANAGDGEAARDYGTSEIMAWGRVSESVFAAEQAEGPFGNRVVKVFCSDAEAPSVWNGVFGGAEVHIGDAGYQLSNGEVVTL